MSEYRKEEIVQSASRVLRSTLILDVLDSKYDYLLQIDMPSIIKGFNDGNYDVLNSENVSKFFEEKLHPIDLIECIVACKSLLEKKKSFYADVRKDKDDLVYDPENVYYKDRHSYRGSHYTYSMIEKSFELAEKVLKNNKIYMLLNFLLKYENVKYQINSRKCLFETLEKYPEKTQELLDVLCKGDSDIGVIKVVRDHEGITTSVVVGTRQDMEISDLIGKPFPSDCDEPGYDYGPHGDYYHSPLKVTKEFRDMGVTSKHARMIAAEKGARIVLRCKSLVDEEGYILSHNYAVIISKSDLISFGIDPKKVGWKPLRISVQPTSLFETCKKNASTRHLSFKDKVQLKTSTLVKRKQR